MEKEGAGGWRGRMFGGISHLWCSVSVIRILRRSLVSKLATRLRCGISDPKTKEFLID